MYEAVYLRNSVLVWRARVACAEKYILFGMSEGVEGTKKKKKSGSQTER